MLGSSRELFCAGFIMNSISHEQECLPHKKTNVTTLSPTPPPLSTSLCLLRFPFEFELFNNNFFLKTFYWFAILNSPENGKTERRRRKTGSLQMLCTKKLRLRWQIFNFISSFSRQAKISVEFKLMFFFFFCNFHPLKGHRRKVKDVFREIRAEGAISTTIYSRTSQDLSAKPFFLS